MQTADSTQFIHLQMTYISCVCYDRSLQSSQTTQTTMKHHQPSLEPDVATMDWGNCDIVTVIVPASRRCPSWTSSYHIIEIVYFSVLYVELEWHLCDLYNLALHFDHYKNCYLWWSPFSSYRRSPPFIPTCLAFYYFSFNLTKHR